MINASAEAAERRARATADRLAEVRARLERLARGEPCTREDVQLARLRAMNQGDALAEARRRLLSKHRAAAARHEEYAELCVRSGRDERAERQREAARRHYEMIEQTVASKPSTFPAIAALDVEAGAGEVARLRQGLIALLSWTGRPDLAQIDRRQLWCRSIIEQCGRSDWAGWIHAACRAGASVLAGVRGITITVISDAGTEFVAASDGWASALQELELIVGEGPSVSVYREDRIITVDDLSTERESWPGYASAGSGHDVRGVVALPLHVNGACVGAMTLYHRTALSECNPDALAEISAFSGLAEAALIADIETIRNGGLACQDLFIVHVAAGALAARLGIAREEAESRMRAHAFGSGKSLREIARLVLDGEDLAA